MKQMNIAILKSRRTGVSYKTSVELFKWQKEYIRYVKVSDRMKIIEKIFNI